PGDHLMHDLQRLAHYEQQLDSRSLEHIWQQVQTRRDRAVISAQRNERTLQSPRKQPEGKIIMIKEKEVMEDKNVSWGMNSSTPLSQAKKRGSILRSVSISLVAAVAVITILSFTVFSGVLRPAPQTADKGSSTL